MIPYNTIIIPSQLKYNNKYIPCIAVVPKILGISSGLRLSPAMRSAKASPGAHELCLGLRLDPYGWKIITCIHEK